MALLCVGCAAGASSAPGSSAARDPSTALFMAAAGHFVERAQAPVRIDTRPLNGDVAPADLRERTLLADDTTAARMRAHAMERAGWTRSDAVEDWRCVFSQGLPPAQPRPVPDTLRTRRETCLRNGPYESLVFGLPEPAADPEHPRRWRIRALRMLASGYEVRDVFLEPLSGDEWRVVAEERRFSIFS